MHKVIIDESASRIRERLTKIKRKILVLSNKGGVGKSSAALSFAALLHAGGNKVGLLDIDMHGPSMAKMAGVEGRAPESDGKSIRPVEIKPGFTLMSMGSFLPESRKPVIWRGPMKMNVVKQFLADVVWGELDYLIIDSPPGTGDEPLTICQLIPCLSGGIIVTTGQDVALLDSMKAVNFLKALSIPVLGVLENMAAFKCPHCAKDINLFKAGSGAAAAKELGVPFLGSVPFDPAMVEAADRGEIFALTRKESDTVKALESAVEKVIKGFV
ncbi:MAG: ATP-binding protein [Elusimicrobia bacterium GWC2_51_8]|nr:MAG: ATP-binding protein [Elusimicrobia bacterium GWA2_51_34]OGR58185.1 MAG: ATP-binding protein [Elusimicrobia bacterium GWC2_51_8]OGR84618.1 MAG: ATP-binding protein [Elusimicrobia bacterium GWF2_52_66]HAF95937.1 ATP-binding protein [Elusimicrobiota bacterium]HCE97547.1 ATP-binding protein [Elusimicrobiota bacterium]